MAKLRMAHASTHGARKPPGPKRKRERGANDGNNNGQATHGARKPPGPKTKVANNNGQLCIATPPRVAHAKPPGPTMACFASSATTGGACKHPWTKIVFFYWKQLGPCSDERRCPCESTKCAGQAFHTFLLPAPIQPPPKSIFGPGGLRAPPVVADESEAGHCVHLFFYIFFYFIFLRLPFFIHFYEL